MQFIEEFAGIDVGPLRAYFAACGAPFEVSKLYNSVRDEKFVDESLRLSKYRAITDPALFDIVQKMLDNLTEKDTTNMYTVVRNDVTQIVYGPGGFFKAHRDFLSMRSNILEEYTLLICITPDEIITEGGETSITVNPHYTHISRSTVTPGGALLFRKDLLHEGLMLTRGTKDIVSVNVWVSRKSTADDAVLFVTFPEESGISSEPVKNAIYGLSYAIPVNQIMKFPDSMLAGFCRFEDARSDKTRKIYTYECKDCSYDDFNVIFKVLSGIFIVPEEMETYSSLLEYYGLTTENVLVDIFAVETIDDIPELDGYETVEEETISVPKMGLGKPCCALCTRIDKLFTCSKCHKASYCSRRCQVTHWNEKHRHDCGHETPDFEQDFIILPSEERTKVVASVATRLLQPYIQFKILFAEGVKTFSGGMSGTSPLQLKMEPIYMTIGDYSNLMHRATLCTTSIELDIIDITDETDDAEKWEPNEIVNFVDEDWDEDGVKINESHNQNYNFELLIAETKTYTTEDMVKDIMDDDRRGVLPIKGTVLPSKGIPRKSFEMFHIDEDGKTAFTRSEAEKMTSYIKRTDFIERVKKELNNVKFQLQQHYAGKEGFFCNESVYAKFNFMVVTGLIRI